MTQNSRRTIDTFRHLKTQAIVLEHNCAELRAGLQKPPSMALNGGAQVRVLRQLEDQVNRVEQEVAGFQQKRAGEVSFDKLLASCNSMYDQIQVELANLENRLTEYGYDKGEVKAEKVPSTPNKLNATGDSSVSTPLGLDGSREEAPDITQDLANLTREIMTPGLLRSIVPSDDDTPTDSPLAGRRAPRTPKNRRHVSDESFKTPSLEEFGISTKTLEMLQIDDCDENSATPDDIVDGGEGNQSSDSIRMSGVKSLVVQRPAESATPSRRHSGTSSQPKISPSNSGGASKKPKSHKESMIVTMGAITERDMDCAKEYLRKQFTVDQLNSCIKQINGLMAEKQFEQSSFSPDRFTLTELERELGSNSVQAKAVTLMLLAMKKLAPDGKDENGGFAYKILQ